MNTQHLNKEQKVKGLFFIKGLYSETKALVIFLEDRTQITDFKVFS